MATKSTGNAFKGFSDSLTQILLGVRTMADKIAWEEVMRSTREDDDSAGGESTKMKSNPCKEKQKEPGAKKRRRTQTRGDTKPLQPSDITYDKFKEMVIVMSFFGLNNDHNFEQWTQHVVPHEVTGALGIRLIDVATTLEVYCEPMRRLSELLKELYQICHTGWMPRNLKDCVDHIRRAHEVTYTNKIAEQGLQCAVDIRTPKGPHKLVLLRLKKHEVVEGCVLENGVRIPDRRVPTDHDQSFVVSTKYDKMLMAWWWMNNLDYLVAKSCDEWVETVRSMNSDTRRKLFPTFASATDAQLAHLFVQQNEEDVRDMHAEMMRCTNSIDKQTNMLNKRKPEYKRKRRMADKDNDVSVENGQNEQPAAAIVNVW